MRRTYLMRTLRLKTRPHEHNESPNPRCTWRIAEVLSVGAYDGDGPAATTETTAANTVQSIQEVRTLPTKREAKR